MKKIILIILLVSIVSISGCVANNYKRSYAGQELNFRANLREAQYIKVYPDESDLGKVLFNPDIKSLNIAYISNESENGFYLADTFEIGYKLTIIYRYKFNTTLTMQSIPVNTTEEAMLLSNSTDPVILLLGPSHATDTSIIVNESLITLQGKSFDETNRKYTDLDLVTDKMILTLMGE